MSADPTVYEITRQCVLDAVAWHIDRADGFGRTFVAKADMIGERAWDRCLGIEQSGHLAAMIITTTSLRKPAVANLQLLHTFSEYRGQGFGRVLCVDAVRRAHERGDQYFRVSSEPESVEF